MIFYNVLRHCPQSWSIYKNELGLTERFFPSVDEKIMTGIWPKSVFIPRTIYCSACNEGQLGLTYYASCFLQFIDQKCFLHVM
jgi:hypothetical protein